MSNVLDEVFGDEDQALPDGHGDFDLVPKGTYRATIQRAEVKETDKGGHMVSVGFELDNGRWVWTNYNIRCASDKAEEIGRRDYGHLCKACGASSWVRDTSFFIGKPVSIRVGIKKSNYSGEDENVVRGVKAVKGGPGAPRKPKRGASAPPRAAAKPPNPWGDKKASNDDGEEG
jgi:hypothetical protein